MVPRLVRLVALALAAALVLLGSPAVAPAAGAAAPALHSGEIPIPDGTLRDGATVSLEVAGGPDLVALTWTTADDATFEVRALDAGGWSTWSTFAGGGDEGPDAGTEGHGTASAGPGLMGEDITKVEVRAPAGAPPGVVLHTIDSEAAPADAALDDGLRTAAAVAQPPTIITRSQWGADESWRDDSGGECDGIPDYVDDIQMAFVHHTAGEQPATPADSARIIRAIYDFHVHTNGWCDVGYNFFVDPFGQVFEGRFGGIRRTAIGGHASGFNTVATGVALLGDFTSVPPTTAAYDSLVDVLAFKLGYHGVNPTSSSTVKVGSNTSAKWPEGTTVTLPNISGHRDGNNTACPGQLLYDKLPQLRQDVAAAISEGGLQPAFTLGRLFGADRFATAASVAKSTFTSAGTAYLARGDDFPDALAASYLAGHGTVPVLLSTRTSVPQATLDSLSSLGVSTVRLLGGIAALGPEVEVQLRSRGLTVDRISGADRYETAAAVARVPGAGAVGQDAGRKAVVLSSGLTYPDALAAGGIVYAQHLPQLLTDPNALPAATSSALTDLGIQHVLITGGPNAVSAAVENQVKALGMTTERVAGADRYATAVALADLAIDRYGFAAGHLDVATGQAFPDALTGGAHAGQGKAPLLLTLRQSMPPAVCSFIQRRGVGAGHVLGGSSAVDSGVKYGLEECIQGI